MISVLSILYIRSLANRKFAEPSDSNSCRHSSLKAYLEMQTQTLGFSMGDSRRSMQGMSQGDAAERVERLAAENAVVVFSMSSCCMCHVVKRLFCSLGVGPTVYELDDMSGGADMEKALRRLVGDSQAVPAVFVGGKLLGGLDRVMAAHISGVLIPQLKEAGALWL